MVEKEYFEEARNYLLEFDGVSQEMIDAQLSEWRTRKPKSIEELFRTFLEHARNRQGMLQSIGKVEN